MCSAAAPWRSSGRAVRDYLLDAAELDPSDVARYPNDKTGQINTVLGTNPLLFDRYLRDAIEVRRRRALRRARRVRRGRHGAYRGGGHPFGRQRLLAAAPQLSPGDDRRASSARPNAGAGARRRRPDERPVRRQGRRHLRARGQPARLAHGAVRRQGDRPAGRQDRRAGHGRREARLDFRRCAGWPMSASRKRCFPSRASPASTRCSGRRCAPPAR